jgi:hypothetical protein
MKKLRNVLYRYRLMTSVLALVLVLATLAVTPAQADLEEGNWDICEAGCVNWNQQNGCVTCQMCCVKKSGEWACWIVQPGACT